MRSFQSSIAIASCTLMLSAGVAFAAGQPSKPSVTPITGQKGAPTNTCPGTAGTPGAAGALTNPGSPFNGGNPMMNIPGGQAGNVYAGNPGTASLANSNSTAAVSQYDVACYR
jgi:hypothetical protein